MKNILFADKCDGIGISRVARDCDLTETIGFYRNEYQMYFILTGERFFYQGNKGFRMDSGTLTFIDKRQIPFTNVIGGKYHERILIEMDEKWLIRAGKAVELDLIGLFTDFHGVYRLEEKYRTLIEKKLNKMEEVMKRKKAYAHAEIKNILLSIFIAMLYGAGKKCEEFNVPDGRMLRYIKVREIICFIMEHYSEVCGLEDVAERFYIDKSYLSRIFKEVTNFTVNEFINCRRIDHAGNMLLEDSLSMEEISQKLGYKRLSYFDRVFKKYVGAAPLQYRKSKQKNAEKEKKESI